MDDRHEREVARGLRKGKPEAWRALYDEYAEPVWRSVARSMGAESADVADVVQEIFLAAARSARNYDPCRGSLWMWLGGIARRQVALHFRKQRRHQQRRSRDGPAGSNHQQVLGWLEGREAGPSDALASRETAALVRAALTELPVRYEILLTAKYVDGASAEQIAGSQQCSATAVRSRLARARRAFRRAFAKASIGLPR